jgi:hypothetical protein
MEIFHIIEMLQMAIGETPRRLISRTASNVFKGGVKQLPKTWSRKRFYLPPIPEEPEENAY